MKNKFVILGISLALEGVLAGIYFYWASVKEIQIDWSPSPTEIFIGLLLSLPLFLLNYIFFGPLSNKYQFLKSCAQFREQIVRPLAEDLDYISALIVSIAAGLGEELFFRGYLQTEFGIILASLAFSLLHFGFAVRSYALIAVIYTAIGFYFGAMFHYFNSLWIPIIVHVTYDYIALLFMRYCYRE